MTRFLRLCEGQIGVWPTLKWLLFTPVRRSPSSSLKQRYCTPIHPIDSFYFTLFWKHTWSQNPFGLYTLDNYFNSMFLNLQGLVTTELEGGDRQKAMKRLRVPPLGAAQVWHHATYLLSNKKSPFKMALTSQSSVSVYLSLHQHGQPSE